jgi:integrase
MSKKSEFATKLLRRLQTRPAKEKGRRPVYVLDFRHKDFAVLGKATMLLRDPKTIGWPEVGNPTSDQTEAEAWVERAYAKLIKKEMETMTAIGAAGERPRTVGDACDVYIDRELSDAGCSQHTVKNRKSYITAHIKPLIGHLPLASLDKDRVTAFLDKVQVWKISAERDWVLQPASYGYKRALRATLRAIWRSNVPNVEPPFEGTILRGANNSKERRLAAHAGQFETLFERKSGAQTKAELRRSLTAAIWYDRERISSRANTSSWAVANTAEAIAFEAATGVRAEELVLLRWSCIDEARMILMVPGTKSAAAVRIIPIQHALLPWIERLKSRIRPKKAPSNWRPDPRAFVFVTNYKKPNHMGRVRALTNRISTVLLFAGTKREGKAQHALRATFASHLKSKLSAPELKQYLGHEDALGGATDVYVEPRFEDIPPEHHNLVTYLPAPEELAAEAERFEPPQMAKRRARRARRPKRGGHYREVRRGQTSA